MVSEKQKAYASKHIAEKLDELKVRPPKGTKERWQMAAARAGQSTQQYIIQAVEDRIQRESEG